MFVSASSELQDLRRRLDRLRGDVAVPPNASIVVPVNAREHLDTVFGLLVDLAKYKGSHRFEIVLVVNNYTADEPPRTRNLERAGVRVLCVPQVWRRGEAVCFSARVPGIRAAEANHAILLDADCRVLHPDALLDWYVDRFAVGDAVAYTSVGFYGLRPIPSVWAKVALHHLARAIKRVVLRKPSTRGSNYAVRCADFLRLYDQGLLADDLNVGPTMKAAGARVAYSGARSLQVLTSGRKFRGGWGRLYRQLRYRLAYNIRMLPVRPNAQRHPYHDRQLR